MHTERSGSSRSWRVLARSAVASCGLLAIAGSGGGFMPDFCFDDCQMPPSSLPPFVMIEPGEVIVQVGTGVTFRANVISTTSFNLQWCRQATPTSPCVDLPGATGSSFTLAGANLADDGSFVGARASNPHGTTTALSRLAVSSAPPVVFADAEFADAGWAAIADPASAADAPTHAEAQRLGAGNPGAFRAVTYGVSQARSPLRLFHAFQADSYRPAEHGAVYVVELQLDCISQADPAYTPTVTPMIEQAGRRFVPSSPALAPQLSGWVCSRGGWSTAARVRIDRAADLAQIDGPQCTPAGSCPDFSVGGAPIRFGFVSGITVPPSAPPGEVVQGIDNWRVNVWRR